jgi:tRNA_anti-like
MDINHKHEVGQSMKGGFGAAFGSMFGKFFGCLGILLLIGVVAAIFGGDKKSSSSGSPANNNVPQLEVNAQQLSKAFQTNEAKAKLDYGDKTLKVSGVVKDIDLDFSDKPVIKLRGSGDVQGMGINSAGKMTDVSANGLSKEDAAAINKGQKLTVVCSGVDEVLGAPQLSDCTVAK